MNSLKEQIRFFVAIATGIVRDQRARRTVLFFVVLVAMLMAFFGAILFDRFLMGRPLLFLLYWGACAWLTFLSMLLAVHDLLMLRQTLRRERQQLKARVLGIEKEPNDGDRDAPR